MKRRIKRSQIIIFLSILSFFIYPFSAFCQTKPRVYVEVILDASGSMAGKVEGRRKMDIAKEVVEGIISEVFGEEREDLAFALRIYGHRSSKAKKDCQDSTLEYPFNKLDRGRLKNILSQVKPLGYTPIAYSLTQAAKDFPQDRNLRRIIILLTDGIESCEDSPCQAAQRLMQAGAFTSIHVIGFGITPESMSLLECITQASGGMLIGAQNASELKKAFEQTVSEAVNAGFRARVTVNGNPTSEATIMLYPSGANVPVRMRSADLAGEQVIYAPPGIYDLAVREHTTETMQWVRGITGEVGEIVEQSFNFLRGGFQLKATINGELTTEARFDIYRQGEKIPRRKVQAKLMQPQIVYIPPGTYDIKTIAFEAQDVRWMRGVAAEAGETQSLEANFQLSGFLVGVTLNGEYTGNARIEVYHEGESQPLRNVRAGFQGKVRIVLPPGRYDLRVFDFISKQDIWHRGISLNKGQIIEQNFDFHS